MLRSVETVQISFVVSVVSLIVNGGINYTLIFGHFGFPEMGIKGAAIGTLTARSLEFLIVLFYVAKIDKKVRVFDGGLLRGTFTAENRSCAGILLKYPPLSFFQDWSGQFRSLCRLQYWDIFHQMRLQQIP